MPLYVFLHPSLPETRSTLISAENGFECTLLHWFLFLNKIFLTNICYFLKVKIKLFCVFVVIWRLVYRIQSKTKKRTTYTGTSRFHRKLGFLFRLSPILSSFTEARCLGLYMGCFSPPHPGPKLFIDLSCLRLPTLGVVLHTWVYACIPNYRCGVSWREWEYYRREIGRGRKGGRKGGRPYLQRSVLAISKHGRANASFTLNWKQFFSILPLTIRYDTFLGNLRNPLLITIPSNSL